jgi:hypothetical protein
MKKMTKASDNREGHCYELAYKHILEQGEGTLVHAEVWSNNLNMMIGHALVETETGFIYEPVLDRYFLKDWLYEKYKIKDHARYAYEEALLMVCKHYSYGPWDASPVKLAGKRETSTIGL